MKIEIILIFNFKIKNFDASKLRFCWILFCREPLKIIDFQGRKTEAFKTFSFAHSKS